MIGIKKKNTGGVIEKEVIRTIERPKKLPIPFYVPYIVLNTMDSNTMEVTYTSAIMGDMKTFTEGHHTAHVVLNGASFGGFPDAIAFFATNEGFELNGIKLPVYSGDFNVGEQYNKQFIRDNGFIVIEMWRFFIHYKSVLISVIEDENNPILSSLQPDEEYLIKHQKVDFYFSGDPKFETHYQEREQWAII